MTEVVLYGFNAATYPWTAMLVCEEKGVEYRIEQAARYRPRPRPARAGSRHPVLRGSV